ncbi:hypothetical protein [uncultured Desulfobacter sp.]|uniref:hypothetical protein n=1 Tax=uncultured Desulfobacter sp. TaxID=240139 RepID=UPI002AAAA957|nr:hypothetical protein [uncultured Desulfobacter sp.]
MKRLSFYTAVGFFFLICSPGSHSAFGQDFVRGKLGIFVKTDQKEYQAKKNNEIAPGTFLRLFLFPEKNCFIYSFHSDGNSVEALHPPRQIITRDSLILPASNTFYEIGAEDKTASFYLIISSEPISELNRISTKLPVEQWGKIQRDLMKKSRILDNPDNNLPFSLAGNVRGEEDSFNASFIDKLPVSSGRKLILRTYDFQIKK